MAIAKLPPGLQIKAKAVAKANGKGDPGSKDNSAVKSATDNKPTANPDGSAKSPAKAEAGDNKPSGNANADKPPSKPAGQGKRK